MRTLDARVPLGVGVLHTITVACVPDETGTLAFVAQRKRHAPQERVSVGSNPTKGTVSYLRSPMVEARALRAR